MAAPCCPLGRHRRLRRGTGRSVTANHPCIMSRRTASSAALSTWPLRMAQRRPARAPAGKPTRQCQTEGLPGQLASVFELLLLCATLASHSMWAMGNTGRCRMAADQPAAHTLGRVRVCLVVRALVPRCSRIHCPCSRHWSPLRLGSVSAGGAMAAQGTGDSPTPSPFGRTVFVEIEEDGQTRRNARLRAVQVENFLELKRVFPTSKRILVDMCTGSGKSGLACMAPFAWGAVCKRVLWIGPTIEAREGVARDDGSGAAEALPAPAPSMCPASPSALRLPQSPPQACWAQGATRQAASCTTLACCPPSTACLQSCRPCWS